MARAYAFGSRARHAVLAPEARDWRWRPSSEKIDARRAAAASTAQIASAEVIEGPTRINLFYQ
jgi:hypothetical protein